MLQKYKAFKDLPIPCLWYIRDSNMVYLFGYIRAAQLVFVRIGTEH